MAVYKLNESKELSSLDNFNKVLPLFGEATIYGDIDASEACDAVEYMYGLDNKREALNWIKSGEVSEDDIRRAIDYWYKKDMPKFEDTVRKSNGKWTNRGDDGTEHGEFKTKKAADAQRRAMYANGYKGESLSDLKKYVDSSVLPTFGEDIIFGDIDASEAFDAVEYMYGLDSKREALNWIYSGKVSEDEVRKALAYYHKQGYKGESLKESTDGFLGNVHIDEIIGTLGRLLDEADLDPDLNKEVFELYKNLLTYTEDYDDEIYDGNANGISTEEESLTENFDNEYNVDLKGFKPFGRGDWYEFSGAEDIVISDSLGDDQYVDPLIYNGDTIEVLITGSENKGKYLVVAVAIDPNGGLEVQKEFNILQDAVDEGYEVIRSNDGAPTDKLRDLVDQGYKIVLDDFSK